MPQVPITSVKNFHIILDYCFGYVIIMRLRKYRYFSVSKKLFYHHVDICSLDYYSCDTINQISTSPSFGLFWQRPFSPSHTREYNAINFWSFPIVSAILLIKRMLPVTGLLTSWASSISYRMTASSAFLAVTCMARAGFGQDWSIDSLVSLIYIFWLRIVSIAVVFS